MHNFKTESGLLSARRLLVGLLLAYALDLLSGELALLHMGDASTLAQRIEMTLDTMEISIDAVSAKPPATLEQGPLVSPR